jgi:Zn-dependent protease with chaperone function
MNRAAARFCAFCGASLATAAESGALVAAFIAPPRIGAPHPLDPAPTVAEQARVVPAGVATATAVPETRQTVLPGPVHRETFYAAQRRHRRRARVLSAVCVLPVALLALLVAALISPWLYLAIAGILRLLRLAGPLPGPAHDLAAAIHDLLLPLDAITSHRRVYSDEVVRIIVALLVPSIMLLMLIWLWVRLRFRNAGTGGVLLRLGARPPRGDDPEEHQLANVAEEVAIAAGLPTPKVLLIDAAACNAAVVGSSHLEYTIVVSRPLLDALDRDELAGVLADLVSLAGNGDLGIALTILSVFQTIGLVLAGRDVLLSGTARSAVRRFLAFSVRPGATPDEREAHAAAAFPGGASASHLFVVAPDRRQHLPTQLEASMLDEMQALRERTQGQGAVQRWQAMLAFQKEMAQKLDGERAAHPEWEAREEALRRERKDVLVDELGMHGLHPSIDKRLRRLEAVGGHIAAPRARGQRGSLWSHPLVFGILGLLFALVGSLMAVVFAMISAIAGAFNFFLALPVLLLVRWLVEGALR